MIPLKDALRTAKENNESKWADVHARLFEKCNPRLTPRFTLPVGATVFTIGSCFARNMEMYLSKLGYKLPMLDFTVPKEEWASRPQGILNKYTPAAIFQELQWTAQILKRDGVVREEDCRKFAYEVDAGVVDNNLAGFVPVSRDRFLERRRAIYDAFRHAFDADCVTITLGLIECWFDEERQIYIQQAPVTSIGLRKQCERKVRFVRLDYDACLDFVQRSLALIRELNPRAKVLITVSPVPLEATFTDEDVITANLYSKSVLRAVAGKITESSGDVAYFPSYEKVMLTRNWSSYESDLRHVSDGAVADIVLELTRSYFPVSDRAKVDGMRQQVQQRDAAAQEYEGLLKKAEAARASKEFALAAKYFALAAELATAPSTGSLLKTRSASMHLRSGNLEAAELVLREVLTGGFQNAGAHLLMAQTLRDSGRRESAYNHAVQAAKLNPNRADIQEFLKQVAPRT